MGIMIKISKFAIAEFGEPFGIENGRFLRSPQSLGSKFSQLSEYIWVSLRFLPRRCRKMRKTEEVHFFATMPNPSKVIAPYGAPGAPHDVSGAIFVLYGVEIGGVQVFRRFGVEKFFF